jgi:Tfp pilus assembly protein PilO
VSRLLPNLPILKRAAAEYRRVLIPLGIALVVNVLVYAFVIYPLAQRVANVEGRNQRAAQALADARAEHARAAGALGGKDRAITELATFYTTVLPRDLAGARRLTHLRLARLARQSNLRYGRATSEPESDREGVLTRLKVEMALTGSYAEMRTFIGQLERAPEFVVIDNVQLAQSAEADTPLDVTLALSTYFRKPQP